MVSMTETRGRSGARGQRQGNRVRPWDCGADFVVSRALVGGLVPPQWEMVAWRRGKMSARASFRGELTRGYSRVVMEEKTMAWGDGRTAMGR